MNTSVFSLTGSSRRRELWLALAIFLLVLFAPLWLGAQEVFAPYERYSRAAMPLAFALLLMASLRRLHALRRNGTLAFLLFVPFAAPFLLGWLLLRRGRSIYSARSGVFAVGLAAAALTIAGLWRCAYLPLTVVSSHMAPALVTGDLVAARYIAADDIERGDIVVLRGASGALQVVRIVGLAGDSLQMKEGVPWLNESRLSQSPKGTYDEIMGPQGPFGTRPRCAGGPVGDGGLCQKSIWTESLPGGRFYDVLNIEDGAFADETGRVTLGAGQFYGLGDNRDDSADSRFAASVGGLGVISADQIVARVDRVLLSSAGSSLWQIWTWRFDRFLEAVE